MMDSWIQDGSEQYWLDYLTVLTASLVELLTLTSLEFEIIVGHSPYPGWQHVRWSFGRILK